MVGGERQALVPAEAPQHVPQVGDTDTNVSVRGAGDLGAEETVSTKRQVAGVTCMTPQAPTGETTCGWFPDSIQARARTRLAPTR